MRNVFKVISHKDYAGDAQLIFSLVIKGTLSPWTPAKGEYIPFGNPVLIISDTLYGYQKWLGQNGQTEIHRLAGN